MQHDTAADIGQQDDGEEDEEADSPWTLNPKPRLLCWKLAGGQPGSLGTGVSDAVLGHLIAIGLHALGVQADTSTRQEPKTPSGMRHSGFAGLQA